MRETILVVDTSSARLQEKMQTLQHAMRYQAQAVLSHADAIEWLESGKKPLPDALLLDMDAGRDVVLEAIRAIKTLCADMPILVMTPYGDPANAMGSIVAGASDFLCKPVSPERLQLSLQNVIKMRCMKQYITWLERKVVHHMDIGDMIGEDPEFLEAVALGRQAAVSSAPVWIEGEPGTGKSMLAAAIHGSGSRAGKPFIAVNCEMLPEHLAPSMLFGRETALLPSQEHFILGRIREADQGTLLLQEIGALSPELQQQLLGMMQSKTVRPLGATTPLPVDVRLICTVSQPDKYGNAQKMFRQKLSQAFQILSVAMPSLKDRKGDMALLAQHFLVMHAASENKYIAGFTASALAWIEQQPWPGNVGQMANLLWRAVMLCEGGTLDVADLEAVQKIRSIATADMPGAISAAQRSVLIDAQGKVKTLKSVQEEAIRFALKQADGCMTRAARSLGIGRSTLYRKVSEYSIDDHISRANQTTRPIIKISSMDRS